MYRRMPKRGFANPFPKHFAAINLDVLAERFSAGSKVDFDALLAVGLASKSLDGVRILGRGELKHALNIVADHVTASARQKIEAVGGSITLIAEKLPLKNE